MEFAAQHHSCEKQELEKEIELLRSQLIDARAAVASQPLLLTSERREMTLQLNDMKKAVEAVKYVN